MIGDDEYGEEQHHHHHQSNGQASSAPEDIRQSHVFPGYQSSYPPPPTVIGPSMAPMQHDARAPMSQSSAITARSKSEEADHVSLFGDLSDGKKRKFILVEDPHRNTRVRVRVTLDAVDVNEIPDSFRKSNSVFPRSWFPMQMQDPPPSSHGSRFFESDDEDDNPRSRRGCAMVSVPLSNGSEGEVATMRMRKSIRTKEVKINELGYRMSWHQSRVFADKTVFLQKSRKFLTHTRVQVL